MGVLYNVLFRNGGGGGGSGIVGCVEPTTDQPEWVLDRRDGGSLVWRRSGLSTRHVKFLDEVQVKVYERDEDADVASSELDSDDGDVDDFLTTSSWSADTADDCRLLCDGKLAADDYTVLLMMSVTVLGLCIGLAYLFTPVNWLLHQLID